MQEQKKSWKNGVDFVLYAPQADGSTAQCKHCQKKFKNQRSAYEHKNHCSALKTAAERQVSIKQYLSKNIAGNHTKLQKIVRYICTSATSINSATDQTFIDLIEEGHSYEEIRQGILDYADEVKKETQKKIAFATISLVMDGATIIQSGWYCIAVATNRHVYYYGCYHLADTTTRAISKQVNTVIDEITNITHACVIGACTDNASNISNVFDPDCPDSLNVLYKKHILRVPCQAHTANLVLSSYERLSPSFSRLRSRIRAYARHLREQDKQELFGITSRCPPIREQRWFTDYDALKWIITNETKLQNAHKNQFDIIGSRTCPITKSWHKLYEALKPLAVYTWSIEADVMPLSTAYMEFVNMKADLERLSSNNNHAKNMLNIVKARWSSTADENLMKLAFFTKRYNLITWRANYDLACRKAALPWKTQEDIDKCQSMQKELDQMITTTQEYAIFMGFDLSNAHDEISFTLRHAKPPHTRDGQDFWVSLSICGPNTSDQSKRINGQELQIEQLHKVAEFYHNIECLPASEAYCERVFKNMRELFDISRMSANDDLIAAQTLVRMSIRMERKERNDIDDIFDDVYPEGDPGSMDEDSDD